jgi:YjjG family noncanonical pyrimidine nucleotidase
MKSARYDWVLLDADGTLFDFDRAQRAALEATATAHSLGSFEAVHDAFVRVCDRVWRRFERGEITADRLRVERFEDLLGELGVDGDAGRLSVDYVRELAGHTDLLPGAQEVVEGLARRVRLLLVTNGLAEVQRARFGASPIRRFFADVVISDEIGVAKPQRGFLDVAFERMGRPRRDRVLMVGDSLSADIEAGVRYGLDTCWFNPRGLPLDGGPTPTFTITRLGQIEGIVTDSPNAVDGAQT